MKKLLSTLAAAIIVSYLSTNALAQECGKIEETGSTIYHWNTEFLPDGRPWYTQTGLDTTNERYTWAFVLASGDLTYVNSRTKSGDLPMRRFAEIFVNNIVPIGAGYLKSSQFEKSFEGISTSVPTTCILGNRSVEWSMPGTYRVRGLNPKSATLTVKCINYSYRDKSGFRAD